MAVRATERGDPARWQGGSNASELSWFRTTTDRAAVLRLYHATLNPPDCSKARYLIIDDFEAQSGMGFTFLILQTFLQQAMQERRVLVFASAVFPNATWRWCNEGPEDFSCYFEPWSHCEQYLTAHHYPLNARSLPRWSYQHGAGQAQFVYNAQRTDVTRRVESDLYRQWDSTCCARYWPPSSVTNSSLSISPMGKSWWWGIAWDMLLRPKAFVERAASAFLRSKGIGPGDRFIVAVVRHGGKHAEEKEVQVSEYEAQLMKLTADGCIGTRNVLIVTETASVIRQFGEICRRRGWNCFASDQNRTDMDYDYWNPSNRKRKGLAHGEPPKSEMLSHIGWHSILNLVVSRRGSALLGSVQSQWVMATLGMMRNYHGRAVTLCSLRKGWRTAHVYAPDEAPYFAENCAQTFPACTLPVSHGNISSKVLYDQLM